MAESSMDVFIATLDRVVYEGKAKSVIAPGEAGVFEVLPYHKKLLSRLMPGTLWIDGQSFPIRRGVIKVGPMEVTAVVEEAR